MPRIKIFVSFDGDHDDDLHDRLYDQSQSTAAGFEFSSCSRGVSLTETWAASSRIRIRAADEMVVICGEHTNASPRVAAELRIAQEEGIPYVLLWGRRDRMCTKPEGAKPGDAMYSWTREILENELSATLRNAQPEEIPERYKRP